MTTATVMEEVTEAVMEDMEAGAMAADTMGHPTTTDPSPRAELTIEAATTTTATTATTLTTSRSQIIRIRIRIRTKIAIPGTIILGTTIPVLRVGLTATTLRVDPQPSGGQTLTLLMLHSSRQRRAIQTETAEVMVAGTKRKSGEVNLVGGLLSVNVASLLLCQLIERQSFPLCIPWLGTRGQIVAEYA